MLRIVFSQTPATDPHWRLNWEDNFTTFDNTKWVKEDNCGNEGQLYLHLAQNVWVENGNLVMRLNNTQTYSPGNDYCHGGTYYYTSGSVKTRSPGPYDTQYGYIEARMKLPFRKEGNKVCGIVPSFWTYRSEIKPVENGGEIDIFEMFAYDYNAPNSLNTCIHTCYKSDKGKPDNPPEHYAACNESYGMSHTLSNFDYTGWHTYALEWNYDRITWYIDNKAIRTIQNRGGNIYNPIIARPVKFIMGISVDSKNSPQRTPYFEEKMYVDYIRSYQLKCDKTTPVNEIANFNTYDYKVKKSITLSGATTIPANSNITLRATDFIELKPGFEVPTGRELYLDVSPCP